MRRTIVILIALAISGCTGQATTLATETLTPEPTVIPLSEIDLEAVAVLPGDLPAGITTAQVGFVPEGLHSSIEEYENYIYVQLARGNESAGEIEILVFEAAEQADWAYEVAIFDLREGSIREYEDIGEAAVGRSLMVPLVWGDFIESANLAFIRCNVVVQVTLDRASELQGLRIYAQRLDSRLIETFCSY